MNIINELLLNGCNQESLLIDCDCFFSELSDYCFFAIDDNEELRELRSVIDSIKNMDKEALVFCCTYGVNIQDGSIYIYSDNLWISSALSIDAIKEVFHKYDSVNNPLRGIIPTDIKKLLETTCDYSSIKYIVYSCDNYEMFETVRDAIDSPKTMSLYWD